MLTCKQISSHNIRSLNSVSVCQWLRVLCLNWWVVLTGLLALLGGVAPIFVVMTVLLSCGEQIRYTATHKITPGLRSWEPVLGSSLGQSQVDFNNEIGGTIKVAMDTHYIFKFHRSQAHGTPYSIWCVRPSLALMAQYLEVIPSTWEK